MGIFKGKDERALGLFRDSYHQFVQTAMNLTAAQEGKPSLSEFLVIHQNGLRRGTKDVQDRFRLGIHVDALGDELLSTSAARYGYDPFALRDLQRSTSRMSPSDRVIADVRARDREQREALAAAGGPTPLQILEAYAMVTAEYKRLVAKRSHMAASGGMSIWKTVHETCLTEACISIRYNVPFDVAPESLTEELWASTVEEYGISLDR